MLQKFPGLKTLLLQTTCLQKYTKELQPPSPASTTSSPALLILQPEMEKLPSHKGSHRWSPAMLYRKAFQDHKRPGTLARAHSGAVVKVMRCRASGQRCRGPQGVTETKTSLTNSIWQNFSLTSLRITYSIDTAHLRNPFSHLTQTQQQETPLSIVIARCWAINLHNSFQMRHGYS